MLPLCKHQTVLVRKMEINLSCWGTEAIEFIVEVQYV